MRLRCVWGCRLAALLVLGGCGEYETTQVTFGVLDVGQGLSQVISDGRTAVVVDIGPAGEFPRWQTGYEAIGSPYVAALVVSHLHEDHYGGLSGLSADFPFSGLIITVHTRDTGLIRRANPAWSARLRIETVCRGAQVAAPAGVSMTCLWPPMDSLPVDGTDSDRVNRLSLVLSVACGSATALLTGDIDTLATAALRITAEGIDAHDLVVIPHHGSETAASRLFYGAAMPAHALLSCARENDFGHPSRRVVDVLFDLDIPVAATYERGHLLLHTSGYYWSWGVP